MAVVVTQTESADRAAFDFIKTRLGTTLGGNPINYVWSPPDRALVERLDPQVQPATKRPKLPTISMHRIGLVFDWDRTLHPRLARLGYIDETILRLRTAKQPVPINLTWQLDFWCEQQREVQALWELLIMGFRGGYAYLNVRIDDVWGSKMLPLFAEDAQDTTDVEQGEGLVYRRFTMTLRTEFWLFDTVYTEVRTIRDLLTELREETTLGLWHEIFVPHRTKLATGNGATSLYNVSTTTLLPISPRTLVVGGPVGGTERRGFDNGAGIITGSVTGTVDYATGALQLQFPGNVDNGAVIYEEHMQAI